VGLEISSKVFVLSSTVAFALLLCMVVTILSRWTSGIDIPCSRRDATY
jgi:hypothetical protein